METGLIRWGAPLAIALLIPVFKPILKEAAGFVKRVGWFSMIWFRGMELAGECL